MTAGAGFRSCQARIRQARSIRPSSRRAISLATAGPTWPSRSQSPNSVEIELNQGGGQFAQPGSVGLAPHNTPLVADFTGDGVPDVASVDGAGNILFRQGRPAQPGSFDPPVTVNPGRPSRDIAAVRTKQGTLLASVDAKDKDKAVSLFAYRNGGFSFVGSLATGVEPAQIVSADLSGDGIPDDLVIRNAGDGTLTVYMSDGRGGFLPPINLAVASQHLGRLRCRREPERPF